MLLSAELGKDNIIIIILLVTDPVLLPLLLFPASYPKLRDFYSVAFFFLMLISMPFCIKNTIAIFAPGSNTFAMLIKGVHVKNYSYYSNKP
jgi:hypothetical protein